MVMAFLLVSCWGKKNYRSWDGVRHVEAKVRYVGLIILRYAHADEFYWAVDRKPQFLLKDADKVVEDCISVLLYAEVVDDENKINAVCLMFKYARNYVAMLNVHVLSQVRN